MNKKGKGPKKGGKRQEKGEYPVTLQGEASQGDEMGDMIDDDTWDNLGLDEMNDDELDWENLHEADSNIPSEESQKEQLTAEASRKTNDFHSKEENLHKLSNFNTEDLKLITDEMLKLRHGIITREEVNSIIEKQLEEHNNSFREILEKLMPDILSRNNLLKESPVDPITQELIINNQETFKNALIKAKIAEEQASEIISRINFAREESQRISSTVEESSVKLDRAVSNIDNALSEGDELLKEIATSKQDMELFTKNETDKLMRISEDTILKIDNFKKLSDELSGREDKFSLQIEDLAKVVKEAYGIAMEVSKEVSKAKIELEETYGKSCEFETTLENYMLSSEEAFSKSRFAEEKAENVLKIFSDLLDRVDIIEKKYSVILDKLEPVEKKIANIEVIQNDLEDRTSKSSQLVFEFQQKLSEEINKFNDILSKSEKAFDEANLVNQQFSGLRASAEAASESFRNLLDMLNSLTERISTSETSILNVEKKSEILFEMALQKSKAIEISEEMFAKIDSFSSELKHMDKKMEELNIEANDLNLKIKESLLKTSQSVIPSITQYQQDVFDVPDESELPLDMDELLQVLVEHKASDLHLNVGSPPYVRLDGNLIPIGGQNLTDMDTLRLIVGLMSSSQRAYFKKNLNINLTHFIPGGIYFKVNAFFERGMVGASIKMLNSEIQSFEQLCLPLETMQKICELDSGLILIGGSVNSGKSATIASIVNFLNQTKKLHIITIEESMEFLYKSKKSIVSQRELGIDTTDFAKGLGEALHQDPDIIVIDEIKDYYTLRLACTAAEAGKLIFAAISGNNLLNIIKNILTLYFNKENEAYRHIFFKNLKVVTWQNLIKTEKIDNIPVFEILWINSEIQGYILNEDYKTLYSLITEGGKTGIISFSDSITDLVDKGFISPDDAIKYTEIHLLSSDGEE